MLSSIVGWASAAEWLSFLMFITYLPALIWMAMISYSAGNGSVCVAGGPKYLCAAKMAMAGM